MKRLKGSDNIPMELINEILLRLPAKSIRRFRCVSKLWGSILHHPNFTELFLTMSSARPRLLFLLERADDEWNFYSSPQPQNPDGKSSLVVAADFYSKIRGKMYGEICDYASGLIHFPYNNVVCNPITGKCAILPDVMIYRKSISFLGFNPIDKQFKLLAEAYPFCFQRDHHTILTLGTGKLEWRGNIDCPWYNTRWSEGICINGVLYYLGSTKTLADILDERSDDEISDDEPSHVKIVCFDVRSEKFKLIDTKCYCDKDTTKLINYKGKLGGIILEHDEADDGTDDGTDDEADDAIKLRMWVLEDVEKQEWSNYVYTLALDDKIVDWDYVSVAGVTATGEIVLSMNDTSQSKPFYVFYFNPERNTLQSVEIQGFGENLSRVKVFIDHVEDLNFLKIEAS